MSNYEGSILVVDDEPAARRGQRAGGGQHDDGADLLPDGKIAQRSHSTGPTMRASESN